MDMRIVALHSEHLMTNLLEAVRRQHGANCFCIAFKATVYCVSSPSSTRLWLGTASALRAIVHLCYFDTIDFAVAFAGDAAQTPARRL